MKNLLVATLLLIVAQAKSQTFEGTIKWSMKMEVTDPKLKAQMEKAQKQMADPATQAKMKQAMEQMNDPKMKAMMDANPQMKAQMEAMMKGMQGGTDPMSSMMPKGLALKVKGDNSLSIMEVGGMTMETLNTKEKAYQLDRKNKTYSAIPVGESALSNQTPSGKPEVKVTKTSEKATILNYACTKYIASVTEQGKTIDQIYWTTTEIKDFDMKRFAKYGAGRDQKMFYEGLEGVPLKMEMTTPQGKMVMEAVEIKRESLNASDFVIPADFKETQGMFGGRN